MNKSTIRVYIATAILVIGIVAMFIADNVLF